MNLRRWEILGLVALLVIVMTIPLALLRGPSGPVGGPSEQQPSFVGTNACITCHEEQSGDWRGSDHDLAMAVATDSTVLGDFADAEYRDRGITSRFSRRDGGFYVWTEGPGGEMAEFEITHVFGHDPLQQYLTPFPGGRLQALHLAWDSRDGGWFHLYPDLDIDPADWLHWTRNGQNWNGMCAECHSTNLQKNFDPETNTYQTTWTDIDVGCEACHGPGSQHLAWAETPPMARPDLPQAGLVVTTRDLDGPQVVGLCAPCHARRSELGDYDHTGGDALDYMLPTLLRPGLYHPDGQILDEVYVYGSFLQSKMYLRDVRCSDCHNSHSLKLVREGNALCLQCHEESVYDTAAHHFHKKIHEGEPSDGALCVKCHMVEQPYMVIDWRADHSFRVPRPDLNAALGVPDACTGCHTDKPLQWSLDAYRKWYGTARKPHYGSVFAAAQAGSSNVGGALARLADSALQPSIVRATAVSLIAPLGDELSRATVGNALQSDDPLLRRSAIANLHAADPAQLVELAAPLLADPVKAVRIEAAFVLAGIDTTLLKGYQRRALQQGIQEYQTVMSHSLDFAGSGFNLGNLYAKMNRPVEAERYYRQAIAVDDLFLPVRMNLAVMLSGQGRLEDAEIELRQAVVADPDEPEVAYSLGLLLVEMGDAEEALIWLRRAADGYPNRPRIRYNLGLLLQQLGHQEEAAVALRTATALAPDNIEFQFALAVHYANRGLLTEALAVAEEMAVRHPNVPEVQDLVGRIRRSGQD